MSGAQAFCCCYCKENVTACSEGKGCKENVTGRSAGEGCKENVGGECLLPESACLHKSTPRNIEAFYVVHQPWPEASTVIMHIAQWRMLACRCLARSINARVYIHSSSTMQRCTGGVRRCFQQHAHTESTMQNCNKEQARLPAST